MRLLSRMPAAFARIHGNTEHPGIEGFVRFYQYSGGVLVEADLIGLPKNESGFHGFHIHFGVSCAGEGFAQSGSHFDPAGRPHPVHAGDLPPILSRNGRGYLAVLTDRFSVPDILGRTVVIHMDADDFHSQPAGKAGVKLACGVIERCTNRKS